MNADPLAQLRDIHLPQEISWWPLAPGWWILIALLVIGAVIAFRTLYRRRKHDVSRQVLKQLLQMNQLTPNRQRLADLTQLLRRVSLYYLPRDKVAALPLLTLIKQTQEVANYQLTERSIELLTEAHYQPECVIATAEWHQLLDDSQQLIKSIPRLRKHEQWSQNV